MKIDLLSVWLRRQFCWDYVRLVGAKKSHTNYQTLMSMVRGINKQKQKIRVHQNPIARNLN